MEVIVIVADVNILFNSWIFYFATFTVGEEESRNETLSRECREEG